MFAAQSKRDKYDKVSPHSTAQFSARPEWLFLTSDLFFFKLQYSECARHHLWISLASTQTCCGQQSSSMQQ